MTDAPEAFPDAWQHEAGRGGKGGKGAGGRGGRGGRGQKGGGYKGQGRKGKGGKDGTGEVPEARRQELEASLEALRNGSEVGAIPRPGDSVQVIRVLGQDRQHLEGRVGRVVGSATVGPSLAVTVHFDGDGAAFGEVGLDLTVAASDLRIVEAVRPLPEAALAFPKTLTGLERKVVHEVAEQLGLITQSFGEGPERYITAYRRAEAAQDAASSGIVGAAPDSTNSGQEDRSEGDSVVELDEASSERLLRAFGPWMREGWEPLQPGCLLLCRGPLSNPQSTDRRTVNEELLRQLATLRLGQEVELRVVSVGKGEDVLAAGVLGVPALARNPHVTVAAAPSAKPWPAERIAQWSAWSGGALTLKGSVARRRWRGSQPAPAPEPAPAASEPTGE